MLKDFIAKLPIDVIKAVEIEPTRVLIPTEINPQEFYRDFRDTIDAPTLSDERAIYLASVSTPKRTLSIKTLLIRGR